MGWESLNLFLFVNLPVAVSIGSGVVPLCSLAAMSPTSCFEKRIVASVVGGEHFWLGGAGEERRDALCQLELLELELLCLHLRGGQGERVAR